MDCLGLALCCCGAATALGLVLRHAASARRRYEARLAEHDRIAHEMHDWLLQSTQGLMLRVQAVSRSNLLESPTRLMLETTLAEADRFIDRERSHLAHTQTPLDTSTGLVDALARPGQAPSAGFPGSFRFTVHVRARQLGPAALEGPRRMIREVLIGA